MDKPTNTVIVFMPMGRVVPFARIVWVEGGKNHDLNEISWAHLVHFIDGEDRFTEFAQASIQDEAGNHIQNFSALEDPNGTVHPKTLWTIEEMAAAMRRHKTERVDETIKLYMIEGFENFVEWIELPEMAANRT